MENPLKMDDLGVPLFRKHPFGEREARKILVKLYIATENTTDFPEKVAFWKGNPLLSGKSRFVKYYNL